MLFSSLTFLQIFLTVFAVCAQLVYQFMLRDETAKLSKDSWDACLLDKYGNAHPFRK